MKPRLANQRDPENTKARLLEAGLDEFSQFGLSGARVDSIAAKAGVNKQLLYYYFGDKDRLYAEVLNRAYADIRRGEQSLNLAALPPEKALRTFMEFTFDYLIEHRNFVALLNDENIHKARHLSKSSDLPALHARLKSTIGDILDRGLADGSFRRTADPVDLYISIASLCYFYHSNQHTLSIIFRQNLMTERRLRQRRRHVIDFVLSYLKSPPE